MFESHFSSGFCIVTFVFPKSMRLKWVSVMTRPLKMAGKKIRSRQLSLGRVTVTAINQLPLPLNLLRFGFSPFEKRTNVVAREEVEAEEEEEYSGESSAMRQPS